jgi:hypothetical protein
MSFSFREGEQQTLLEGCWGRIGSRVSHDFSLGKWHVNAKQGSV